RGPPDAALRRTGREPGDRGCRGARYQPSRYHARGGTGGAARGRAGSGTPADPGRRGGTRACPGSPPERRPGAGEKGSHDGRQIQPRVAVRVRRRTGGAAMNAVPVGGELAGRTAVVTGAAQGIGAAVTYALAAQGATVAGVDLDGAGVAGVAEKLVAGGM